MKVDKLFYGSWYANCYVVTEEGEDGKLCAAVIDPAYPAEDLKSHVDGLGATLQAIILTHGHFDHICFTDELRRLTGAPVYVHRDDAEMLTDGKKNAYSLFFGGDMNMGQADALLSGGDSVPLGNNRLKVIHTPGHSRGSVCLLSEGFMITGDTLFSGGYGRYDLYGGDPVALSRSLAAPHDYDPHLIIYPGHGQSSTLGDALDSIYF